jgi:hypothetical protein
MYMLEEEDDQLGGSVSLDGPANFSPIENRKRKKK